MRNNSSTIILLAKKERAEKLLVRLELNSSEKMILCIGDTTPTYKLSDIPFEYDAVFDERYAAALGEFMFEEYQSHIPR